MYRVTHLGVVWWPSISSWWRTWRAARHPGNLGCRPAPAAPTPTTLLAPSHLLSAMGSATHFPTLCCYSHPTTPLLLSSTCSSLPIVSSRTLASRLAHRSILRLRFVPLSSWIGLKHLGISFWKGYGHRGSLLLLFLSLIALFLVFYNFCAKSSIYPPKKHVDFRYAFFFLPAKLVLSSTALPRILGISLLFLLFLS